MDADELAFQNKYSRQIATMGLAAVRKLVKARILIVGCGSTGSETAKNVILQGSRAVTLHDPAPIEIKDLGLSFCYSEESIGQRRDGVAVPNLQQLNKECLVSACTELTEAVVSDHTVMIVTSAMPKDELIKWNEFCRNFKIPDATTGEPVAAPIAFIYCMTGGAFGTIFVDHGDKHTITDADGERPQVRIVTSISSEEQGLVRFVVPDGEKAEALPDDCTVEFEDVEGCYSTTDEAFAAVGVNINKKAGGWKTTRLKGDPVGTLRIGDTSVLSPYVGGGTLTVKKVAFDVSFRSLAASVTHPGELPMTDMLYFGSEYQQHVALQAVLDFQMKHGRLPGPNSAEDAAAVVALAEAFVAAMKAFNESAPGAATQAIEVEVDAELVAKFARHAAVELQPLGAFLGGVVAQEVVKCGGKYTPIPGFLHFNAMEVLPAEPPADTAPTGTRYDNLVAIFGAAFVAELGSLKYFMVGCGALGCEFLKNFALNGVCCGPAGKLTVTDADRVELSNLARQFLFREDTVGKPKSTSACAKATQMNPAFTPEALEMFVGPKTEDTFNDAFWTGLDGVCNALDNIEARFYVDEMCVKYSKSLLESGTMGTAGNIDPIVPYKTTTYRDGGNAVEGGGIPMCTLRNFPHLIDHCIEWARDQFAAIFVKPVQRAKVFAEDPDAFLADLEEKVAEGDASVLSGLTADVANLIKTLKSAQGASIESCAQLAFDYFHALFRDKLVDLTTLYPRDARIVKDGVDKGPFWSEKKKFPTPATYDPADPNHRQFMLSTTHLVACMLGVHAPYAGDDAAWLADQRTEAWINGVVAKLAVPEYVKAVVDVSTGAGEEEEGKAADEEAGASPAEVVAGLIKELAAFKGVPASSLEPADFEKDDDYNFHIDFVTGASNLRAANYSIPPTDFSKAKLVAGKIIPAIATTTASVTGLVLLELFKMVQKKDIEAFRSRAVNLAVNVFTSFELDPPMTKACKQTMVEPPAEELGPEDYDEKGKVKKESYVPEVVGAYPDRHSCWDKLVLPADMTLTELVAWFEAEHKLKVSRWGLAKDPYVYPPKPVYGPDAFPAWDLPKNKAFMEIRSNKLVPQSDKMAVLSLWEKGAKVGAVPDQPRPQMAMKVSELLEAKHEVVLEGRSLLCIEGLAFEGTAETPVGAGMEPGSLAGVKMEVPEVYLSL